MTHSVTQSPEDLSTFLFDYRDSEIVRLAFRLPLVPDFFDDFGAD